MNPVGQITLESAFGKELTRLAEGSVNIVETGTFYGLGSTRCLHKGMKRLEQRLYSIDYNAVPMEYARTIYKSDPRVIFLYGTLTLPHEFAPLVLPDASAEFYAPERDSNVKATYVIDALPSQIDLLVIDGGGWTASVEFDKLIERTRIVALDDTNRKVATKNWRNLEECRQRGFKFIAGHEEERNGWAIFDTCRNTL